MSQLGAINSKTLYSENKIAPELHTHVKEGVLLRLVMIFVRAVKGLQRKYSIGERTRRKNAKQLVSELQLNKYLETVLQNFELGFQMRPQEFNFDFEEISDSRSEILFRRDFATGNGFKWFILCGLGFPVYCNKKQNARLNKLTLEFETRYIEKVVKESLKISNNANEEFKKDMLSGRNSIKERMRQAEKSDKDIPF